MATRHVIIGGGPAGINAIETIRALDPSAEITLIGDEPAYSRMVLPYYLAGKIPERAVFTGDGGWFAAQQVRTCSGGASLECDVVIMATGIRPHVEFRQGSGIRTNQGVLVDGHLRSSAPNVYTAGDAAEGPDLLTGRPAVHAIQPTAVDHGRVAGANMAGMDVAYSGSLSMNILGVEACSFGFWQGDGRETTTTVNEPDRIYRKYGWEDDRLVGGILVGPSVAVSNVNNVGMLKGLIQTGVSLGPWKAYLEETPLDLRRPYAASDAARALL